MKVPENATREKPSQPLAGKVGKEGILESSNTDISILLSCCFISDYNKDRKVL